MALKVAGGLTDKKNLLVNRNLLMGKKLADEDGRENLVGEMKILRSLFDVGAKLYACRDRREMLETILTQAQFAGFLRDA